MRDLAQVGAGDRLHVLRPLPPRLEGRLADRVPGEVHDLGLTIPFERPHLVRRVEPFDLYFSHLELLSLAGTTICPRPSVRKGLRNVRKKGEARRRPRV